MVHLHEMRAYGQSHFVWDDVERERGYSIAGFIALDEDEDDPVQDIYTDPRMPVCGSNWGLVNSYVQAPASMPRNKFILGLEGV